MYELPWDRAEMLYDPKYAIIESPLDGVTISNQSLYSDLALYSQAVLGSWPWCIHDL